MVTPGCIDIEESAEQTKSGLDEGASRTQRDLLAGDGLRVEFPSELVTEAPSERPSQQMPTVVIAAQAIVLANSSTPRARATGLA